MVKRSFACLLLSSSAIGAALVPSMPSHAAPPQNASTLLKQSIARMKTLRTVHGEAYLQGGRTNLRISGDCEGQVPLLQGKKRPHYSFRTNSWARGTLKLSGKRPQRVDDHLIEILSGGTTALWERTPATHGVWRPLKLSNDRPLVNLAYTSELCDPLFANSFHFPVGSGWKDMGTIAFHGNRVRWVQMKANAGGGTQQIGSIDIDPRTLYWVHFQLTQTHPRSLESFDFSRFNAPVTITAPQT